MREEVEFLGHKVSGAGTVPLPAKTEAIRDYPRPTTSRGAKRFVGMINFYRTYIPNASVLLKPITKAMSKTRLEWDESCEGAFVKAKQYLMAAPILAYPDYSSNESFIVTSDASSEGCGGYLSQVHDGGERVISYFSKSFSERQANMSATDKELEGLRESLLFFRPYILDHPLRLRVDHRPLVEMAKSKHLNARLYRIYELMRGFDLTIEYLPGKFNLVSDALSRVSNKRDDMGNEESLHLPSNLKEIQVSGGGDALVKAVSLALFDDQARHGEVRRKIITELKKNPETYNLAQVNTQQVKMWGLEGTALPIELLAAVAVGYNVTVQLHQAGSFPILFTAPNEQRTVHLIYKGGMHCNAAVTINPEHQILCLEDKSDLRLCPGITEDQVRDWQSAHGKIERLKEAIEAGKSYESVKELGEQGKIPKLSKKGFEQCRVRRDVVVKVVDVDELGIPVMVPWLPEVVAATVIEDLHRALSHVGGTKVLDVAKMYMAVQDLKQQVVEVVAQCEPCQMGKASCGVNRADPLQIHTSRPYQLVAIDLAELP